MHAVIRTYSGEGAKELFDLPETRKSEVESPEGSHYARQVASCIGVRNLPAGMLFISE